ncbi:MAG TPA: AAA family ATPase, partial [Pirellulaceae bacterium]|nr:AAA family ATPase [Pirellulaceae bacterium]
MHGPLDVGDPAYTTPANTGVATLRLPVSRFKPDGIFRLQAENELLSQIESPHFLKPLKWGVDDQAVFVSRREPIGINLKELLTQHRQSANQGGLDWPRALHIGRCVLDALQQIHATRCAHRHVRLSTVWVDGNHAVLDCPPPQAYQDAVTSTAAELHEFAEFASPELSGSIDHDVGPPSDLYAVGALLFALVSGQPPFRGESVGGVLFQHVATEPDWRELGTDPPLVVVELIARLLRKEPHQRYQSAAGVLADIDQILDDVRGGRTVEWFAIGRHDQRATLVEPAFVGRTSELRRLHRALDSVQGGSDQRIAITCPSGMGKSRIVLELIRSAVRAGFHVYRSIASDEASQQPAAPLIQLVNQLADRASTEPEFRRAIQRAVADIHGDVAVLFPTLVKVLGWDVHSAANSEELGAARIQAVFVRLLTQLAQPNQPALIWMDDCQWIDTQSLSIIEALNQASSSQSLFLFSMRDAEGLTDNFLERVRLDDHLVLQALSDDEVGALVESMAGTVPQEAAATVVRLAAGSPFMASAVVFGLVESGAIAASTKGWIVDPDKLSGLQASSSAATVLLNRLEQLPNGVLKQLTTAAVVGKEFQERTIAELSGFSYQASKDNLEIARSQRLIWTMPDGRLAFVHDKIRETLLDRLTTDERQQYHLRYAQYLQQTNNEHPFELAYHFYAAGAVAEALPYALLAADAARRLHSLDRAEELLRIAWHGREHVQKSDQLEMASGLADVLMLAGKYDEAQAWFETAHQLVDSATDLARLSLKRGELGFKRGDKELAVQLCSQALAELKQFVPRNGLQLAGVLGFELCVQLLHSLFPAWLVSRKKEPPAETERLAWHLFSRLAHGYWYTKTKNHTLWAHLRNLNLAERFPPTPELAQAYSEHAPAMSLIPWHGRGIQYAQKSLKMRQALNDVWGQGQSRNFYSILLYSSSQFDRCIEQATQAESILVRTGDFWEVNIARYQLAASLYRQGKLKDALDVAQRTYEAALAIGDYQSTGNIIDVWARAGMGSIPPDILSAEKVRTLRDRQGECQALLAEGVALFFQGHYIPASDCFQKAIRIAERAGVNNTFTTPNYAWLATALRKDWLTHPPHTRRARKIALNRIWRAAKRAVRMARWFQNDMPHALREYGAVCALLGWPRHAQRALRQSMDVARKQGAAYELALTEKAYGKIGLEFGWHDAEEVGSRGRNNVHDFRQLQR